MKGARGMLGGLLVLLLVCAVPAVSAAQDSGSSTTTTSTTPSDPGITPPAPSESPAPSGGGGDTGATSVGAAAGTPTAAATDSREPSPQLRGGSPADASSGGEAHKSASTTVTMGDFFFRPATMTVSVGDIVTWRNDGHEPHTATADDGSFDTGTVPAGGRASHMFTKPGTFTYVCTIHPNMKGTIRVVGSGGGGAGGSASGSASGPTEAQAVQSPNAAGDKNTLPMSGMPLVPLTLAGLALLGSGLGVRRSARQLAPGQQLSLF